MIREVTLCVFSLICPNITGCNQENEKEILLLGGVCKPERSQGSTSCRSFCNLIRHTLFDYYVYNYSLIFLFGSHYEK